MPFNTRLPRFFLLGVLLACALAPSGLRAQGLQLMLLGFEPADLRITNQGQVSIRFDLSGTTSAVDVTLFRNDGASTLVAGLVPGSGPFLVQVPLPRGVDGQTSTFTGVAQDTVTGQLVAGDRQLTVIADDVAPSPPNITSPDFPAVVFQNSLTIQGTVSRAGGTPETTGTVLITLQDPGMEGTPIGAGVILADGSFTATADLTSITTGSMSTIGIQAEDEAGNQSTLLTRTVDKREPQPPALQNLVMNPAGGTLTNNPAVQISGSVSGVLPPFTVNFFVDGFLESQLAGLEDGATFNHTLTLSTDGARTITVRATNSGQPPASGDLANLGVITLDREDPPAPIIIDPNPAAPLTITTGTPFTVRGFSSERAPSPTSTQLPVIRAQGPSGVSFAPASPLTIDPRDGTFTTQVNIGALDDGTHTLTFTTVDAAGNSGSFSSAQVVFIKDTLAPIVEEVRVDGRIAPQRDPEIFVGQTSVELQIRTNEDLVNVPRLTVTQSGGSAIPAGTSSNTADVFNFVYGVIPGFDGPVNLTVSGGRDRAGNELRQTLSRIFVADTVPPRVVSVDPADGTTIRSGPEVLRIQIEDPRSSSGTASGPDLARTVVVLQGPLGSASRTIPGTQTQFDPRTIDFTPESPLTQDGLYRVSVMAVDLAGNRADTFQSLFRFDSTPIAINDANVRTRPAEGDFVNAQTMPGTAAAPFVEVIVNDPEVDLDGSSVVVRDFCSVPPLVPGTQTRIGNDTLRYTFQDPLPTDGSRDGRYAIGIVLRDQAGNLSPEETRVFTYDTITPSVPRTFPATDEAVRGPLRAVDASLADRSFDACREPSGIDRSATSTTVAFTLIEPNPNTNRRRNETPPLPVRNILRFISEGDFDKVLLEITNERLQAVGLATNGSDDGLYRFEVQAIDRSDNVSPITSVQFLYDTLRPDLFVDDLAENAVLTGESFLLEGSTRDNPAGSGIDRVEVSLEAVDADGNLTTGTPIFRDLPAELSPLAPGETNPLRTFRFTGDISSVTASTRARLTVTSFDRAGNTRDERFTVQVMASTLRPPSLSAPADLTSTANPVITFSWVAVAGAVDYRLRLIGPNRDELIEPSGGSNSLTLNLTPLSMGDGEYFWSVASVDGLGRAGEFGRNRKFTLDTENPRVVAVDILDPSPESAGSINEGEVRFTVRFSEAMDTSRQPTARVVVPNRAVPPLTVEQTSFDGEIWTGRATIPESPRGDPDYNGLAQLEFTGAFDRAGNELDAPPGSLTTFEIDTGPLFRVRLFQNPVDPREVVMVVKGFTSTDGVAERVPEAPTIVATRLGEPAAALQVHRISESAFQGTLRVSLDSSRPVELAITGRDDQGNTATRQVTLNITVLTPSNGGTVVAPGGGAVLKAPPAAVARETPVIVVEGQAVPSDSGSPAAGTTLPGLAFLGVVDAFQPEGLRFERDVELELDTARFLSGASTEMVARAALYSGVSKGEARWLPTRLEKGRLAAQVRSTGPYTLMADIAPPRLEIGGEVEPDGTLIFETDRPRLTAWAKDGQSGLDPEGAAVIVDGARKRAGVDEGTGEVTFDVTRPLAPGPHEVAFEVSDRAGNTTRVRAQAVAPAPFGLGEVVAYPNPARRQMTFRYRLTQAADTVRIRVHDTSGDRVTTLSGPGGAGTQDLTWGLADDTGGAVANGVYLVVVEARLGGRRARKRLKVAVLR